MKSNQERHDLEDDKLVTGTKPTRIAPPKLRKNKRLDKRWGQKYYATVREAVFMMRTNPYMPAEVPPSLRNEADDCQPLYVCKQCKDCFHFLSSFEGHNSRRSWILGFWCHHCFVVDCSHSQSGQPPCFDCQVIHRKQKKILRCKGLRKGRKMGCIKIFYNQCQFFAHLKEHQTTFVDMADVMLMPMPTDADRECYDELDQFCKTIMERMFLTRTHIMDWLNSQQLGNKWWSSLQSHSKNNENSLAEILAGIGVANSGKKSEKFVSKLPKITGPALPSRSDTPSSISETIESVVTQSACRETVTPTEINNPEIPPLSSSVTFINPMEPIEDDDDPCTTADIAFVDCGPAAKTYPPEVAILLPPKDKLKITPNGSTICSSIVNVMPNKADSRSLFKVSGATSKMRRHQTNNVVDTTAPSTASPGSHCLFEPKISVKKFAKELLKAPAAISCQKNYSRLGNQRSQPLRKLAPATNTTPAGPEISPAPGMETTRTVTAAKKAIAQASLSTLGPRILTVHSPKNADLSKIISQLPPDVINGKKIVFIGQDTEHFTILPKNEVATSSVGMIKIQSETDKAKIIQSLPTKVAPTVASNIGSEQSSRTASQISKKNHSTDKARPTIQQIYLDGKVIYQNGKKFVIRHARKPIPESTICNNSNYLKLHTVSKRVSLSSFLSKTQHTLSSHIPIVPKRSDSVASKVSSLVTTSSATPFSISPSVSLSYSSLFPSPTACEDANGSKSKEQIKQNGDDSTNVEKSTVFPNGFEPESLSSTSRCSPPLSDFNDSEVVEYFSIQAGTAGRSYVDFSNPKLRPCKIKKGVSWMQVAASFKQKMVQNFRRHGEVRFKQQIDHLMEINSDYSRMLGVVGDIRILDNLKAIDELRNALKELPKLSKQDQATNEGSSDDDVADTLLNLEETVEPPHICPTCDRPTKSKSHILNFSKGSGYCTCDSYVCHICGLFQGNISQFRAHLNFHAKKEPFICPECFRTFSTFHRLNTHTRTKCLHPLTRRCFKCKVCQVEGFLDTESLTKHFVLTHGKLKIACPECGILLKSQAAFQKHRGEDHPKAANVLKPVNLLACNIGNCLVHLEDYRTHMNGHIGVIQKLYYKCSLCSFITSDRDPGRELMRSHLNNLHSKQLSDLYRSECVPIAPIECQLSSEHLDHLERPFAFNDNSPCEQNLDSHDDFKSNLSAEKNQDKDVVESEQSCGVSESVHKNMDATAAVSLANNSQGNESSSDYLDARLTKQTMKDGVECSVWSINLGHSELADSTDSGPDSLEIMTTIEETDNTPDHVINEYSSSPKIFNVRSVTPDSYAELGGVTKEQNDSIATREKSASQSVLTLSKEEVSETFAQIKVLGRSSEIVSEGKIKDSPRTKMSEQILPIKLPQVTVINQAETNLNLTEMLQSTFTESNTFMKLSDITESADRKVTENAMELSTQSIDETTDVPPTKESSVPVITTVYTLAHSPRPERCKKVTIDSTSSVKLPGLVGAQPRESLCGKKQIPPMSLLKSRNKSISQVRNDITELGHHISNSHDQVPAVTQAIANTADCGQRKASELLLRNDPKPPPLARIPSRLLDVSQQKIKIEEEEAQETETTFRSMVNAKRRGRRPWRIALNASVSGSMDVTHYRCHLCSEPINTAWSTLRSHFSSRHSQDYKLFVVTPRLLRMSSDFIAEGYKEVLGSKKRKSDGSASLFKRRRRWNPKKHIEKHSLDSGFCVQQESVEDGEGNFICKKCDQRCNDILTLRTHIGTNHRIKDHYLVCLECGENFVVEPSLQMHLKAFHRIQDPCSYMAQNTGYVREITESTENESKTGIANQCHVCMAVFEDKLTVDKHLRVHGMAFLNRKRLEARNAAQNPEKRRKIDKPDDGLDAAAIKNEKIESHRLEKTTVVNGAVSELQAHIQESSS